MTDYFDSRTEKTAQQLVKDRQDIWFVWTLTTQGIVSIRAITTKLSYAKLYVKLLKNDKHIIKVWVEATLANHLLGQNSIEQGYGNGPIKYKDFNKK